MANLGTSSEWNITTDIYDIVSTVDNLKKRYIEDENETTLALGIFGYIGDLEAKKIQTSTIMAGELGNEMFPGRSKLTKNVLTYAAYSDISNINAIPATITLNVGLRLSDLDKYMVDDKFVIDCNCPIFVGDYEFHFDYDVIITRTQAKSTSNDLVDGYSYSAQYRLYDEDGNLNPNRLSDITNQYLIQPFTVYLDNYWYLIFQATLHQYTIETTTDKLVTDSVIANKNYVFDFENQLADFDVYITTEGVTHRLRPFIYGSDRGEEEFFCWYLYLSDHTVRISFDSASVLPGLNSDIEIKAYTTLGAAGNFEYTKIDSSSEGFYLDISSDTYGYYKMTCFAVATTDATNGIDRKSKAELQKLIPKAALARGSITTETDVNNYFNLLENENNRLLMQKKVDNQLTRTWYAYFLLKDAIGNIIPTNTININIDLESEFWVKSPDGRVVIPAGASIRFDSETGVGTLVNASEIPNPIMNQDFYNDKIYYYTTLYNIILCRNPLYSAFYITAVNENTYYTFQWVNSNADTQFVANRLNYRRNLLTDQNIYHVTFSIAQSILKDFGIYRKDTETIVDETGDESTIDISSMNLKCIMVLYKEGVPYRWKECTFIEDEYVEDGNYIYPFYIDFETDNGLDDKNAIKLNNLHVAGSSTDINYGYFEPTTEARLYIIAKFDSEMHEANERGIGNDNLDGIAPGYEDYVVTNIYNVDSGLILYENYTDVINSRVTAMNDNGTLYEITGIPVVGAQYINVDLDNSEDNADYVMDAIKDKKAYIDYCIELIENNMDIDFKFFNTYGPTLTYFTEDEEKIGHIDITLDFNVKLRANSDIYTKDEIVIAIKDIIEDIYDVGDLHIPNLITAITNQFGDRIEYIEFIGFNKFGPGIQHIIKEDVEDPHTVPEFINIRNIYNSISKTLEPCININIV